MRHWQNRLIVYGTLAFGLAALYAAWRGVPLVEIANITLQSIVLFLVTVALCGVLLMLWDWYQGPP